MKTRRKKTTKARSHGKVRYSKKRRKSVTGSIQRSVGYP